MILGGNWEEIVAVCSNNPINVIPEGDSQRFSYENRWNHIKKAINQCKGAVSFSLQWLSLSLLRLSEKNRVLKIDLLKSLSFRHCEILALYICLFYIGILCVTTISSAL